MDRDPVAIWWPDGRTGNCLDPGGVKPPSICGLSPNALPRSLVFPTATIRWYDAEPTDATWALHGRTRNVPDRPFDLSPLGERRLDHADVQSVSPAPARGSRSTD